MLETVSATEVRCCGIVYLLNCGKRKLFPPGLKIPPVQGPSTCQQNNKSDFKPPRIYVPRFIPLGLIIPPVEGPSTCKQRCPICRSAIGQASCWICACRRQLFKYCRKRTTVLTAAFTKPRFNFHLQTLCFCI